MRLKLREDKNLRRNHKTKEVYLNFTGELLFSLGAKGLDTEDVCALYHLYAIACNEDNFYIEVDNDTLIGLNGDRCTVTLERCLPNLLKAELIEVLGE